ncbi:MAG: S9 family peptidase [Acidobacteria bacterium]|nr:S9 family peptidase [Acidobacteriota bacterium]
MALAVRLSVSLWLAATALGVTSFAQAPPNATDTLTLEAIYDPDTRLDFSGGPTPSVRWIDDSSYLETRRLSGRVEWLVVDAVSGQTSPLFDPARMESTLSAMPGVWSGAAAVRSWSTDLVLNPSRTGALVTLGDDLFVYDFAADAAVRLTTTPGVEEEATFSPNGRLVAFVRDHNLYVADVDTQTEVTLTEDGSPEILNGILDWLYQEEIYGRGRFRGYWWSPDSTRVAFLQLDERGVPEFTVIDDVPHQPTLDVTRYPRAGDPNPRVKLGIAGVDGRAPHWVELGAYADSEILIVDVEWVPDAAAVTYQVQDREQTWLDLNAADASSGRSRQLLRETTPAWVNVNGSPVWLEDGSFLWLSERSGFKHLYRYRADGTLIGRVTEGRWAIRTLYGVDDTRDAVYLAAGIDRHVDTHIYRIGLDGSGLSALSRTEGTHRANFNPSFSHYIDAWSDVTTPTQVRLHDADGADVRVISANPVPSLARYRLPAPRFVEVVARDGVVMDAMMITPPDFDPSRRYPVYQWTYAGPGTALVRNAWGGSTYMYHQLLASRGVIVWVLDNRSAGGRSAEAQWPIHGRLGELELRDLEDGVAWLARQPYVDVSRLVLHGWSYGGFMTAYALTHSSSWAAGIVGAPVTDWRNYDTVYTERYMKTPQHNPEGYRLTAPRLAAAGLRGRLLLIHGGVDDNVHRQNSEQFVYALQQAGKPFEMMIYPRQRHGVTDPRLNAHLRRLMFDFIMRSTADAPPGTAEQIR